MKRRVSIFKRVAAVGLAIGLSALPAPARAAKAVTVDCAKGDTITSAIGKVAPGEPLNVVVQGACVENVVITRDDVAVQGPGASITAASASAAVILLDGAQRVAITGLTLTGGDAGVLGSRGATWNLRECTVQGGVRFGVVAANGSTGTVDGCTITGSGGSGAVAANQSTLYVTNSLVENHAGSGVVAIRGSHVRVGQDIDATPAVKPVTIRNNAENGVAVLETSAAIVVGGTVENNGRSGIFVGRSSAGQIGVGSLNLLGGVTVRGNGGYGIAVESSQATILGSAITGNARAGVSIANGGGARIGIKDDSSGYVGNTIQANGRDGISVATGAAAILGGNTIHANGTDGSVPFRFGVVVTRATATLVGGNTVSSHPNTGVFVGSGGTARIGDPGFGLPSANLITGNGGVGDPGAWGGILASQGGVVETRGATISGNIGAGVQAFENGIVELREGTVVDSNIFGAPGFNGGHGIIAGFRSVLRLRDPGTTVTNNQGDGIQLFSGSVVDLRSSAPPVSVTSNAGLGLRCQAETNYSGNATGVTGNAGGDVDGFGNIPGCIRF